MSNVTDSNLNVILGQLEDELRAIKSAREQADGVVSANSELSARLERVVAETRGLVEESNNRTRDATESLANEVDRLSEQSQAIKKAAADSADAITRQASDAQATLKGTADSIASTLSTETKRLASQLQTVEESSAEISAIVQKQAADGQAALEQAANDAIGKMSDQMSELADQAISTLSEGIGEARGELGTVAESTKAVVSDIKASGEALLEANEAAKSENLRQNEETRALLEDAQKHLADIDASIATLKAVDVDALTEEIRGLRTEEADNVTNLKSQLNKLMIVAGSSAVLCLIILIKLFIG